MRVSIEDINVVLIDEPRLRESLQFVSGCRNCCEYAAIRFDYILDAMTGCDPHVTEYVLCRPGKCPQCAGLITEKTLVLVN